MMWILNSHAKNRSVTDKAIADFEFGFTYLRDDKNLMIVGKFHLKALITERLQTFCYFFPTKKKFFSLFITSIVYYST